MVEITIYENSLKRGRETQRRQYKERVDNYYLNPIKCTECFRVIDYKFRKTKKFCSRSCSAKFNNRNRALIRTCVICGVGLSRKAKTYCSQKCQHKHYYVTYIDKWLSGEVSGCGGKTLELSKHVRRYLLETRGSACSSCGWDDRHPDDSRVLTEVDHIDGDASNCSPENLRILCPNCHAKTPTFRARNRKSSRARK